MVVVVVVVVVVRSGGRQYKRLAWPSFTHDRNLTWSRFGFAAQSGPSIFASFSAIQSAWRGG